MPRTMDGPYADLILDAADVCANCFARIRTEELDDRRSDPWGAGAVFWYAPIPGALLVGYGPGEGVSEHKGSWCRCGVEHPYPEARNWPASFDAAADAPWIKDRIIDCIESLQAKDVSFDRDRFVEIALSHWYDDATPDPDQALADALDAALV